MRGSKIIFSGWAGVSQGCCDSLSRSQHIDKTKALQKLLNGTATKKEIELLKRALASGEISIGGNVNQSVIIIGSGNTVEFP
jgi:hypothetical protein